MICVKIILSFRLLWCQLSGTFFWKTDCAVFDFGSASPMKNMKCQAPQGAFVTGATVIGWNLTTPDGDVLAYTNLRYAITLSRFGAPLVMLGHSVILSRLSRSFSFFCHFLSFAMSFGKHSDCASASFQWGKSKKRRLIQGILLRPVRS